MASIFYTPTERRYAQYPRRYRNEYWFDARRAQASAPAAKGSCATLASARQRAVRAIEMEWCSVVRVFDHKLGQYILTFKKTPDGIRKFEGFVK